MTAMLARRLARGAMGAADVQLLYRSLLGREPEPAEVSAQLAATRDWWVLLSTITASDEFRNGRPTAAVPRKDVPVNVWHPDLARWGHPPGTWSADREAVMGQDGVVFLARGTNSIASQYSSSHELPEGWAATWAQVVAARRDGAAELGAVLSAVIVPDKISVLRSALPEEIVLEREPPARTLADVHGIGYPVADLAAAPGGGYLRGDTHLSFDGNAALGAWVLRDLGVDAETAWASTRLDTELHEYLSSGDLGSRFEPPIVEVIRTYNSWGRAEVVEDNRDVVAAAGRHVGTRRVLRNGGAADDRVVVLFGDSYAFPQIHYHGLGWQLAQHFREVHFVWVPFGWDPDYVAEVRAEVVVCESAERFVPRPPEVRIRVPELTSET